MKTAPLKPHAVPPPRPAAPDSVLAALLPAYFERRAADARRLAQALAEGDYVAIAAIGHRLKGLGSTYGHDSVSAAGRALEAAAGARDEARLRELIDGYTRLLAELH